MTEDMQTIDNLIMSLYDSLDGYESEQDNAQEIISAWNNIKQELERGAR